jgi:hypothetical protein
MSRLRDERGPPRDRNQRFGDSQRQQLDAPHWVRPQDRVSVQGQAGARPDGPPTAIRPPGGAPARAPGAADGPRSPGMWAGNRGAVEARPRQFDGARRSESHQHDAPRWARRDDVAPSAAQDHGPSMPRGAQPRASTGEGRSRAPDAQRDWTAASPDTSVPGPGMTRPAAAIPRISDAPRGPRNGSGFGSR